jgi:probable rRNA maturation factor
MIHFKTIDIDFPVILQDKDKDWLENVIKHYGRKTGEVFFLFCSDEHLYKMNVSFLDHSTYTDIITFNTSDKTEIISGEMYISIERVFENSLIQNTFYRDELNRVMVHGLLHLIGYRDKIESEIQQIRSEEDYCLSLRQSISNNQILI